MKYFDSSDTSVVLSYQCTILKAPTDTILNYYARVYNEDEERIYDGFNAFLIWHNQKMIVKENPHTTGSPFVKKNIKKECIPNFIYSENPYNYYLTEATRMRLSEISLDNEKVWKIEIDLPVNEEITFFKRILYIEQTNFYPVKLESFARFQNIQDEYSELIMSDIQGIDAPDNDFLNYYNYPEDYTEEIYKEPKIDYELLANGTSFIPVFTTEMNGTNHLLSLNEIAGKLIILDFWYLGCPPCLRTIPKLVEIANKYKHQGLTVYGLNPYDGQNRSEEIEKFAKKFRIEYQLLFVDKSVSEKYRVKSFPTLYVVKNGVIIYSQIGYTSAKMTELENFIKSNITE